MLNTSEPETKLGTLEREVNKMAKVRDLSGIKPLADIERFYVP